MAYLYPAAGAVTLPLGAEDTILGRTERHPFERLPGFHPGLLAALESRIRDFRATAVIALGGRSVKYGALARRIARRSWALVYRNIGEPRRWHGGRWKRWLIGRLFFSQLDGFVAVSRENLSQLERYYGLDVPGRVLPRAISVGALKPGRSRESVREELATPLEAPVVVAVGSLTSEKRPDRLLRIAGSVGADLPGLVLWIAGDGPERAALEAAARRAPALDVRFLGIRDSIGDVLGAADVFLLCSDTEGVPGSILEAGAVGLPVLATRVGGVPEVVEHGRSGLLFHPEEETKGVEGLRSLLTDGERGARFAAALHRKVLEDHTIENIAEAYEGFLRVVLQGRKSATRD